MSERLFQRKQEDFKCGHCDAIVQGNGYTNHCPHCLWSCHVDVHPGDRSAACGGLMEPVNIEAADRGAWKITHRCKMCGYEKRNRTASDDSFDEILALSRKCSEKL